MISNPAHDEVYSIQHFVSLSVVGGSCLGTLVYSSTNKTDTHDITEILLKVALNTITLTQLYSWDKFQLKTVYFNPSGSIPHYKFKMHWWFMVFNASFNNISVIRCIEVFKKNMFDVVTLMLLDVVVQNVISLSVDTECCDLMVSLFILQHICIIFVIPQKYL